MLPLLASLSLLGWLVLDLFRGKFWKPLLPTPAAEPASWPSVEIIIPARDEANIVPHALPSLLAQDYPGQWHIILVDDHSSDGTSSIARETAKKKNNEARLTVITPPPLSSDWKNGKLAALNAGLAQSTAEYVLFTDADIKHHKTNLRELVSRAVANNLDLTSLMVLLHCETFAEKLLIPAFVFFFAFLYPFRTANNPKSKLAAAAGGVILIKRAALDKSGGLEAIKTKLIDDCALAKSIKQSGGRTELTHTYEVDSLRPYPKIADIWPMITRTAFTQLHHSLLLLIAVIIGMSILFSPPLIIALASNTQTQVMAGMAWALMAMLYLPTILLYRLPFWWAVMLPVAALIYIGATIDSTRLYWQNKGGQWKGRISAGSQ